MYNTVIYFIVRK